MPRPYRLRKLAKELHANKKINVISNTYTFSSLDIKRNKILSNIYLLTSIKKWLDFYDRF